MLLIMTHEKTDFDALASQLAAHKLYPQGTPLLSRELNRNVQQFLNLYWDALPFVRMDEWQRQRVEEVILVDTHNLNSVRGLVKDPGVRVIDHHTDREQRPHWTYHVAAVGATTTLLVERVQQAGLALSVEEATLLLLGIYEDTGSLTYDTTTARDARAAAWLLEHGAQLEVVRRFLSIPLTVAQQALYDALQANAEWLRIHGQVIMLATAVAPPDFEDEISSVAHRLRETLTPAGLFVLVQLGPDVQVVARSSHESIDVGWIARQLGGGGHSRAAAALVVKESVTAVVRRLKDLLAEAVEPLARVAEIMSYGVQTIAPTATVAQAATQMQRTGHEGYPVVDPATQELVGLLTRRAVDRAVSHELDDLPVSRVMKAGVVTVRPSESIERVQQLMLAEGWGQIPVVAENAREEAHAQAPIGIVTRTDLLNFWFKPPPERAAVHLKDLLATTLSPALWDMVCVVSATADDLAMPLYFVGGIVRDVLLDIVPVDLDMVVEADAIRLVRRLQERFGGEVHTHRRFGTAKWFLTPPIWQAVVAAARGGEAAFDADDAASLPTSIDFVTARTEFYNKPTALPEVERGSIKLDLHRRDFTINTLAVRLDGAHLGQLLDFYGGRRDLERGLVRVLHSLSFIDDPTRILRAVRLEQRLGFHIEPRTLELIADALPLLARVTGDRIRNEIELALTEANPIQVMRRLAELDVMAHLHSQLAWTPEAEAAFVRLPRVLADPLWRAAIEDQTPAFLYFALWLAPLPRAVHTAVLARLRVRKTTRDDVLALLGLLSDLAGMPSTARPSMVERVLRPYRPRVLLAARVICGDGSRSALLERYLREWRTVKTALTGDDLRALGQTPGPQFARWLDHLLAARLDGLVSTEAEERALLATLIAGAPAANDL